MSKLWVTEPVFVITNVTLPDGTAPGESVKPYSNSETLIVPPGPGAAVVVVATVVVAGGAAATPTASLPFMPFAAWPGIVQRYAKLPFFLKTTLSVAVFPGAMVGVFLPLILKSWPILPLFSTLKMTVPTGTVFLERTNLNSVALTTTVTGFATVVPALAGEPRPNTAAVTAGEGAKGNSEKGDGET